MSARPEGAVWLDRAQAAIASGTDLSGADQVAVISLLLPLVPPDFALRCGRDERLNDLGMVGHAIASSRTLEQALGIWAARSGDLEPLMRFNSSASGNLWRIDFAASANLLPGVRRFLMYEWLSNFFAFLEEVTGETPHDARIDLRQAPLEGVAYECWLPVRPQFRQPANILTLPRSLLSIPLRSRNDEVLDLILRHLQERPTQAAAWSVRVRRALMSQTAEDPTLNACASALGISSRSLVRRLGQEGTTFGRVLDDHRRELALILARESQLGAKDIARAVGFGSHQSLRRAFRAWTGKPLGEWRAFEAARALSGRS
jgi:AraC-like DNA-binding protein